MSKVRSLDQFCTFPDNAKLTRSSRTKMKPPALACISPSVLHQFAFPMPSNLYYSIQEVLKHFWPKLDRSPKKENLLQATVFPNRTNASNSLVIFSALEIGVLFISIPSKQTFGKFILNQLKFKFKYISKN